MTSEFEGRVALVTGAAGQGLGQATARRLAEGGATVVVTDIHERRTREVADSIARDHPGTRVAGFAMDAGDREQIDAVIEEVTRTLGPVRVLVNNAAVNVVGSIFDYDPENWDWCIRVNLSGPWYLCRATMPLTGPPLGCWRRSGFRRTPGDRWSIATAACESIASVSSARTGGPGRADWLQG